SFYQNRSSNQLVGIPMPGTTGFNILQANLEAIVQNQGVEIELNSHLVKSANLKWEISFNLSIPKNKLISFSGLEESTYSNQLVVGEPLGIRKMYYTSGVDPNSGIYQIRDYDQDGNISTANDREWIADRDPDFYGGLGNFFKVGKFEIDFLFQFTQKKNWNFQYNGSYPG